MMRHDEIIELLGAYALDAVDPKEAVEVEAHLETCAECRSELDSYGAVTELLAEGSMPYASDAWPAIEATITEAERFRPRRTSWLAVAAALLVLVIGAQAITSQGLRNDVSDANDSLAASEVARQGALAALESVEGDLAQANETLDSVLADPLLAAAQSAAEGPQSREISLGTAEAFVVIVLAEDGTGYVLEHNLPALSDDETYQLWAIVDQQVISAAVLGPNPGTVPFRVDTAGLAGFAVTQEEVGGVVVSEQEAVAVWLDS